MKSSDVKVEGQFYLDLQPAPPPARLSQADPNLTEPQVHIAENHPEYAVLELTCSCGKISHIRCEYDNT